MTETSKVRIDPEDRRKHLDFIQAIITRMSAASSTTKSWMLPVVTAAYGYAITQGSVSVALLGIGGVLLFAYLDANYLRQEKRYRRLYMAVAEDGDDVALFSLDPSVASAGSDDYLDDGWPDWMPSSIDRFLPGPGVWVSWSVGPFYLALTIAGVVVAVTAS